MAIVVTGKSTSIPYQTVLSNGRHTIVADEPEEHGGNDSGFSPKALLAASLISCTLITLQMYIKRKGWDFGMITASVDIDNQESKTTFRRSIRFENMPDPEQKEELNAIADKCPVHKMLQSDIEIITDLSS